MTRLIEIQAIFFFFFQKALQRNKTNLKYDDKNMNSIERISQGPHSSPGGGNISNNTHFISILSINLLINNIKSLVTMFAFVPRAR